MWCDTAAYSVSSMCGVTLLPTVYACMCGGTLLPTVYACMCGVTLLPTVYACMCGVTLLLTVYACMCGGTLFPTVYACMCGVTCPHCACIMSYIFRESVCINPCSFMYICTCDLYKNDMKCYNVFRF